MLGNHLLKRWSQPQATIALSPVEAELSAAVKASAESLGVASLLQDYGKTLKAHISGEASAATGIISRHRLGHVRHQNTAYLWIQ